MTNLFRRLLSQSAAVALVAAVGVAGGIGSQQTDLSGSAMRIVVLPAGAQTVAAIGPSIAHHWPEVAAISPSIAHHWPEVAAIGPSIAHHWPEVVAIGPSIAHHWPEVAAISPSIAHHWPA